MRRLYIKLFKNKNNDYIFYQKGLNSGLKQDPS